MSLKNFGYLASLNVLICTVAVHSLSLSLNSVDTLPLLFLTAAVRHESRKMGLVGQKHCCFWNWMCCYSLIYCCLRIWKSLELLFTPSLKSVWKTSAQCITKLKFVTLESWLFAGVGLVSFGLGWLFSCVVCLGFAFVVFFGALSVLGVVVEFCFIDWVLFGVFWQAQREVRYSSSCRMIYLRFGCPSPEVRAGLPSVY